MADRFPRDRSLDLGAAGDGAGDVSVDVRPDTADDYSEANAETRERLWWAAGTLYRRRWVIVGLTALVAVAAVALTLRMPNEYRAETRVLLPESGGGGLLAGALSNLPPAAAALIGGGGGGGFTRYMAILTSPSTMASVVERFDLVDVYDLSEAEYPHQAAVAELYERAAFEVSLDYDYLGVSVLDRDPERAAQMANFFVERLNERHIEFQSSSAAENRAFLRDRLDQANVDLDEAQGRLQAIQERSGVVEPSAQAEALFSSLGQAQAAVAASEVQYRALLSQYGAENPDVQAAQAGLEAARAQVARLRSGAEAGLPGLSGLPRVQREYASALQDLTIQKAIIETVQPLYEQAALEEQREADAVQVLDPATPPTRKAAPRRSLLVIAATLSAFLVVVAGVLLLAVVRRVGPPVLARLRAAA
ncbi:Wzz/FepE/Etk N-terminal domain-containing protein [Rubrivirga sp.]|uniref:Wzz/FepE/Etk N-terminal domain-containing protein n=1 Tax=Rubrivirga sp. TaxID=1885344 RepID=UPI003B51D829